MSLENNPTSPQEAHYSLSQASTSLILNLISLSPTLHAWVPLYLGFVPSSSLSILSSQYSFNPLLSLSLCSLRGLLWVRSWVGLSRGWSRGWIGKKWLSQCLINDPSVACPATLGLHVSTSVHTGRGALFWEEMVSAAHSRLPIKRKRFTVIKGQIKAHNGDIDFFSKPKNSHFGKTHSRTRERYDQLIWKG